MPGAPLPSKTLPWVWACSGGCSNCKAAPPEKHCWSATEANGPAELHATGATLHELRADAAIQGELVDTPPARSGFVGLHTKAMVIDRERSFIGAMNLDPRSGIFNSEMGGIIDSPPLATH
jgi:phosphatidylserine/phosphatidylglycerophosphate/cardiolipin synthase-like enzyme